MLIDEPSAGCRARAVSG